MGRVQVLVTVLLAVLAGCAGFLGSTPAATPEPSVTPAPIPLTPEGIAPGITAHGVTDPSELADAHNAAMRTSFTLSANQTTRSPAGTLIAQRTVTVKVAANYSRHSVAITVAGPEGIRLLGQPPARAEFWSDGHQFLRAYTRENQTTYNEYKPSLSTDGRTVGSTNYWVTTVAPGGQPWSDIQPLFRSFEPRLETQVDAPNRRVYRLSSSTVVRPDTLARAESMEVVQAGRFDAVVDANGLVRRYNLRYTGRIDGRTVIVTRRIRVTQVGSTTVGQPDWYGKATNGTTEPIFGDR